VLFIPELSPVPKVLRQMQNSRIHLAVVVDEYGSTQGIVTLEDVLEEIVGEIEDEFDVGQTLDFVKDGENFRVSGLLAIHELKVHLPALADVEMGEIDTLGGYVVKELGRFPRPGDTVQLGAYHVRVAGVQENRVGQVLILPSTQQAMRADGAGKT